MQFLEDKILRKAQVVFTDQMHDQKIPEAKAARAGTCYRGFFILYVCHLIAAICAITSK